MVEIRRNLKFLTQRLLDDFPWNDPTACQWNAILWKLFLSLQRFKKMQIQLKVMF